MIQAEQQGALNGCKKPPCIKAVLARHYYYCYWVLRAPRLWLGLQQLIVCSRSGTCGNENVHVASINQSAPVCREETLASWSCFSGRTPHSSTLRIRRTAPRHGTLQHRCDLSQRPAAITCR